LRLTDNPYNSDELWEPLKDYSGYEISNTSIRNTETKRLLKIQLPKRQGDYPHFGLVKSVSRGKNAIFSVHKLIAKQNIPDPNNLPIVNHKDCGILFFSPSQQNSQHAIDKNYNIINIFISIKISAENVGSSKYIICKHFTNHLRHDNTILINGYILRKNFLKEKYGSQ